MTDDWDLLQKWAADGSQDAFAQIVDRYINLVYASARRRLRDSHAAEDVTQAVFLLLSQRAATLRRRESLLAWLFTAVRFTTANVTKMQRRREHHEHLAAAAKGMTTTMENNSPIAPGLLDESIDKLSASDRTALLLRFFQEKSLADVATAMGIAEKAAEKRVNRAVGRLRTILLGKGAPSQEILATLTAIAAETAPLHMNAAVLGTVTAGANAATEIKLLADSASRVMSGVSSTLLAATVTILVLACVAVSAFISQRSHPAAPPPVAAAAPVTTAPHDAIAAVVPFDVVVKQSADDPAVLLKQAHDGIAAAEQKLRNLRAESIYTAQKLDQSSQWVPDGEVDQTLWMKNAPAGLMRDDVHKQITEWIDGAAPFYQEQYLAVYDGTVTKQLKTAGGPPKYVTAYLEGRVSAGCLWPSGSPWQHTIYGVLNGMISRPPLPKLLLSEAITTTSGSSARHVTLNGRECIEILFPQRSMQNLYFVDPSHGWALVGYDLSSPQQVVVRFVVSSLMSAGPGIEIPADVVGIMGLGKLRRYEIHTTVAVANDPAWSDKIFQLDWPPNLTEVWDDRTNQAIRLPSKPSPSTSPAVGEHGL